MIKKKSKNILKPFAKKPIDDIIKDFENCNLYEDEFVEDLKEGLENSSVYKRDASDTTSK